VQRIGLVTDVERTDDQRPRRQLVGGARVLREHEHAVTRVEQRPLLGNEVEAVEDRVHEQHVVFGVRGGGERKVVGEPKVDRAADPLVHFRGDMLDLGHVLGVLRDLLTRRVEQREHPDSPTVLGMALEQQLEGAEATQDVLRRIRAVDPHHETLGPPSPQSRLPLQHGVVEHERIELARIHGDRASHRLPSPGRRTRSLCR
jgi:hypothetical protein